ncbi:F0F1 ATP synthase subunit delta [Streptococcus sp. DD12]|uniref:F0F1 ATP synthase subunit delta n=1 Tax=Streptococcus sp. DD12 TaxID=1777880 RepID=UPI00079C621B|nr:F0F1 ATP synthase subunit delta [Streptococcus sp. DD12]KXT75770.1 ATP synthase delta chain [Streptococcus sp. DD12]
MDKKKEALLAQYAKSLVEVAIDHNQTQTIHDEIEALLAVMAETDLATYLRQANITKEQASKLLGFLAEPCSTELQRFLTIIGQNNREADLEAILEASLALLAQETGHYPVLVKTATPLREDQKEKLLSLAKSRFGIASGDLVESVDKTLIGGFVINAKNQVIDTSIRSQLQDLKTKLK